MIVEHLEQGLRDEAAIDNDKPKRWNRASSVGRCPRENGYQSLIWDWCQANPGRSALENEWGIKRDPLQPRLMHIFKRGDKYDEVTKDDLPSFCVPIPLGSWPSVRIDGVEITGTPDAIILPHGEWPTVGLVEIKGLSDRGYDRLINGEVEFSYLAQAWVYAVPNNLNPIVFICVRKQTDHCVELIFDRNCKEKVVSKRYGGSVLEIARDNPILMAEVRSPFDETIESRVREIIKSVANCHDVSSLPQGVRAVEPETIKVQGKDQAEKFKAQYGEPVRGGSWFTFKTGRTMLSYPCSYCLLKRNCFPDASLELDNGKPKWIVPAPNELARDAEALGS